MCVCVCVGWKNSRWQIEDNKKKTTTFEATRKTKQKSGQKRGNDKKEKEKCNKRRYNVMVCVQCAVDIYGGLLAKKK